MISPFAEKEIHLRDYLYVLSKRKIFIVGFFLFSVLLGIVFTSFEPVLYRSTATLLIEKENPNVVDFKEVIAFDTSSTEYYQTQYKMLESQTLIQSLINKEHLDEDPYLLGLQKRGWRTKVRKHAWLSRWFGDALTERTLVDLFVNKMLDIEPVRNSRLVAVHVTHSDRDRASEIANTLVHLYIQRNLRNRYAASRQAGSLIADQLVELKDKVAEADRKLQAYKEEQHLVNIPSIHEQDEFIQDARLELVKLQAEESKLAKRYLPAHPKMIHLHSQIQGLQEKIDEQLSQQLDLSRLAIRYAELEREAQSARKIYESLLERMEETHSEANAQVSNIMIVDKAIPLPRPFKPRPALNLLISIVLGLAGGVLLAYFIEYLDASVKIPDDIEKGLGLRLLGIIPYEDIPASKKNARGEIFLQPEVNSSAAESFRALRTALLFKLRSVPGCKKLLVTSPNPEEGKSTIALNLAVAFAQNHLRVLLIDTDLRKPRLHKALGIMNPKGISDVLEGTDDFDQVVLRNVEGLGMDFLAAGTKLHHPTEMLGLDAMRHLLDRIQQQYDVLVFDSSPYLAVADVAVLSEYVDEIVVAARYQKTDKRQLNSIDRVFNERKADHIGVVINRVSVRDRDYYYQRYYYYGYGDQHTKK